MVREMDVYVEDRPWGKFEKFVENEKCTVKILYLNPDQQTSLQYHDKRDEWWKILQGSIIIHLDGNERRLSEGESISVNRGSKHQIINQENTSVILEISKGEFDENDIVRVKDIYNRE